MSAIRLATLDSLWAGEMMGVCVNGTRVLLVNVDGEFHAYEDRCAHKGVALSAGRLDGRVLTCWAHEWQYDAVTGEGINPPGARLRRLPLKVVGEDVLVELADAT